MSNMNQVHGVVYCDGHIILLEPRQYYSPTVVTEDGSDVVKVLKPIPTLELTPARAEEVRRTCMQNLLTYEHFRAHKVRYPETIFLPRVVKVEEKSPRPDSS